MPRKALGRGLSSLLREPEPVETGLSHVPVGQIDPNPFQPRRAFPEETLKELADSIRSTGVVQPILLRRAGETTGRFQLISGERRLRAAKVAGLESVPALVRELSDKDALEYALTENLLREDLNPLEVARGYETLQKQFRLSHEEIAGRLGISRSAVTNTLRLLRLAPEVQEMLASGRISFGHARALLALESAEKQCETAALILKHDLSVRQAEDLTARLLNPPGKAEKAEPKLDANTRAAILELERTLGTRVRISGTPGRGRLEISYYSAEDLTRLFDLIVHR